MPTSIKEEVEMFSNIKGRSCHQKKPKSEVKVSKDPQIDAEVALLFGPSPHCEAAVESHALSPACWTSS
jgi:hypothetical protein